MLWKIFNADTGQLSETDGFKNKTIELSLNIRDKELFLEFFRNNLFDNQIHFSFIINLYSYYYRYHIQEDLNYDFYCIHSNDLDNISKNNKINITQLDLKIENNEVSFFGSDIMVNDKYKMFMVFPKIDTKEEDGFHYSTDNISVYKKRNIISSFHTFVYNSLKSFIQYKKSKNISIPPDVFKYFLLYSKAIISLFNIKGTRLGIYSIDTKFNIFENLILDFNEQEIFTIDETLLLAKETNIFSNNIFSKDIETKEKLVIFNFLAESIIENSIFILENKDKLSTDNIYKKIKDISDIQQVMFANFMSHNGYLVQNNTHYAVKNMQFLKLGFLGEDLNNYLANNISLKIQNESDFGFLQDFFFELFILDKFNSISFLNKKLFTLINERHLLNNNIDFSVNNLKADLYEYSNIFFSNYDNNIQFKIENNKIHLSRTVFNKKHSFNIDDILLEQSNISPTQTKISFKILEENIGLTKITDNLSLQKIIQSILSDKKILGSDDYSIISPLNLTFTYFFNKSYNLYLNFTFTADNEFIQNNNLEKVKRIVFRICKLLDEIRNSWFEEREKQLITIINRINASKLDQSADNYIKEIVMAIRSIPYEKYLNKQEFINLDKDNHLHYLYMKNKFEEFRKDKVYEKYDRKKI